MKYTCLAILIIISHQLVAQKEAPGFGEVTAADFNSNTFPDAHSVVLIDKARLTYEWRGESNYPVAERHLRVKINKREAFAVWGDYVLGNSNVEFSKIKAATYYLEAGRVISSPIERNDIMKDKKSSNEKIFSLNNLREGCIVEITFTATFFRPVSPNWTVQHKYPVVWSEYALGGTRALKSMIIGGIEPAIEDGAYKGGTYARWVFKNVPAFKEELHMPAKRNYLARLEFFLPRDNWTVVSKEFQNHHFLVHEKFQKRLIKKTASEITTGMIDDVSKVKTICMYVKNNFEWDGEQDYLSYDLNYVYEKKRGSSGDLNILLHTMLQEAGYKPTLVLLSTQSHGGILKELPSASQFNYIISKLIVGEKTYFLDATDPLLPFDVPPMDVVNTEGFEMVAQTFNWIPILPVQRDKVNVNARLTITPDLALKGRVTVMSQGYEARKKRCAHKKEGEVKFIENTVDRKWVLDSARLINQAQLDQPFQETYFTTIPERITETPERVYIDPYILLTEKENIWKDDSRAYPIDLRMTHEKLLVVNLTLPDGYKVETLPTNQTFALGDNSLSCSFKVSQSNNILVISYQFTVKKIWFSKDQYADVRDFYNQIIARQNQPIVLLKQKA